jgi:hypothetical protein
MIQVLKIGSVNFDYSSRMTMVHWTKNISMKTKQLNQA